jgi:predicted molibdopterin-dependent oxidoreductase YjgC
MAMFPPQSAYFVRSICNDLGGRTRDRQGGAPVAAPGVVYTTFHHPETQANVVTTEFSDWATNCPEYKVTAVQVSPSNGPSEWQREFAEQAEHSRRIAKVAAE